MKRFKEVKESKKVHHISDIPASASDGNNENSKIQEVEKKLGPFEHGEELPGLGVREKRLTTHLDNGVTYTGEWYTQY